MRVRTLTHRTSIAALVAGIAATGALALPAAPASAASDDVTITLRLTFSKEGLRRPGASVIWRTPASWPSVGGRLCDYMNVGETREFQITVPKGTWFTIGYSEGCPAYIQEGTVNSLADHNGQLVEVTLGAGR